MQLYDGGRVPNARRVRIFLAEKGIRIPVIPVDLGKKEHLTPEFTALNPLQRVPLLVLDNSDVLTESLAICRYFDEIQPEPCLFGRTPLEKAQVEMRHRQAELELYFSVQYCFRHLHPAMEGYEVPQIAAWGEVNKTRIFKNLTFFDQILSKSRFLVGDFFSVADITALVAIDFMKPMRLGVPEEHIHLRRWYEECSTRPSARA